MHQRIGLSRRDQGGLADADDPFNRNVAMLSVHASATSALVSCTLRTQIRHAMKMAPAETRLTAPKPKFLYSGSAKRAHRAPERKSGNAKRQERCPRVRRNLGNQGQCRDDGEFKHKKHHQHSKGAQQCVRTQQRQEEVGNPTADQSRLPPFSIFQPDPQISPHSLDWQFGDANGRTNQSERDRIQPKTRIHPGAKNDINILIRCRQQKRCGKRRHCHWCAQCVSIRPA